MAGSKKYRGKVCVYCRTNKSSTADHIFPREFFQIDKRADLPKVPACQKCNNEKSKLEHYLAAILPFGATHSDAKKELSIDVAKRLKKNKKLHQEVKQSFGYRVIPSKEGGYEQVMVVGMNYEILHKLVGYIGRGLMWYHWERLLPVEASFTVFTPSKRGMKLMSEFMKQSSRLRVNEILGGDAVRYRGVMSEIDDGLSYWAIQLFGGMTVADENIGYMFKNSFVAMVSGPKYFIKKLEAKLESPEFTPSALNGLHYLSPHYGC